MTEYDTSFSIDLSHEIVRYKMTHSKTPFLGGKNRYPIFRPINLVNGSNIIRPPQTRKRPHLCKDLIRATNLPMLMWK